LLFQRASDNLRLAATTAAGPKIEFGFVMGLLGYPQKKSWVCSNSHQIVYGKLANELLKHWTWGPGNLQSNPVDDGSDPETRGNG